MLIERGAGAAIGLLLSVAGLILSAVGVSKDPNRDTRLRFTTGDASYHGGAIPDIHVFDSGFSRITTKNNNGWLDSSAHKTIDFDVGSRVGQHIQLNGKRDGICLATIGFNIQGGYKGGLTGDMWYECGGYLSDVTNIRVGGKTIRCGYLSQGVGTPDQVRFHVDSFSVEVLKKFQKQGKNICKHPHFDAWNKKAAASAMDVGLPFNSSEVRIFECSPDYYLQGEDRALTACNSNLVIGASIVDECHNSYCDMSNKTYYDLSDKGNTHLKTMLYNSRSFDKQLIAETIID